MLGGPQEAWADDRVCVCSPWTDTPGTPTCSRDAVTRADTLPALAVVTPGGGAGGGTLSFQAALRKRTDGHTMDQGLALEQAPWQPLPSVQTSSAWSAR